MNFRKDRNMGKKDYIPRQPERTYLGTSITPRKKGLPKDTESLCPECREVIPAVIYEEDGRVMMIKSCPADGESEDS